MDEPGVLRRCVQADGGIDHRTDSKDIAMDAEEKHSDIKAIEEAAMRVANQTLVW